MSSTVVSAAVSDGVAVLTVDNPPVNTLSIAVREALHARLDELSARTDVRAVVLMCAGKTFFSGADISEFSGRRRRPTARLFGRLEGWQVPIVAAMRHRVRRRCRDRARLPLPDRFARNTLQAARVTRSGSFPARAARSACTRLIGVEKTLELVDRCEAGRRRDRSQAPDSSMLSSKVICVPPRSSTRRRSWRAARPATHSRSRGRSRDRYAGDHRAFPG